MELEQTHTEQNDQGQALVEYSFLIVTVAIVCFATLQFIGGDVAAIFQQIANGFPGA